MGENVAAATSQNVTSDAGTAGRLQGLLLALAILLTAVLGGLTWAQRAGWSLEQPQVLGISPPDGTAGVPGNAPVAISFNMPMNPDAVASSLKIDPPTEGVYGWQGNTLVFTPTTGYQRGVTYTVEVGTSASSPLMRGLAAPAVVSFKTAGLPSVYRSVPPADSAEVPTDTMVTIQFSQPMVPLAALDSRPVSNGPEQIQITPAPEGRWQWLGTTTLAYRTKALAPATRYIVVVSRNFADIAGGQLDRDYSFSFSTIRPAIAATRPEAGARFAAMREPIVVRFNQPVDRASAEAGFALVPGAPGTFGWSDDSTTMTYTLSADLQQDVTQQASLRGVKAAAGSGGDLAMDPPASWSFHTSPVARVASTDPADKEMGVSVGKQILVRFTAPISATAAELTQGVIVEPAIRGVSAYLYDENTTLSVYAQLAPSTTYTFTVGANGKYRGHNGELIPAHTWSFTTGPLPPNAWAINSNRMVSFYAGGPTRAFIEAVNVEFVRLRLWRLDGDELVKYMRLQDGERRDYTPASKELRVWDLPVEQVLNKRQALYPNLALDETSDRLPPGFYLLRVTTPVTIDSTAVIVGNAALTMKKSDKEVWIWAVDMRDGRPLAGREIRVLNDGQPVGRATTDANGLALLEGNLRESYTLVALTEGDGDAALVGSWWTDGIAAWSFGIDTGGTIGEANAAIYTDRPIYRPGQSVYFKGILRDDRDGSYSLPRAQQVSLHINNPIGQQVYSATLPLSPFGGFGGEFRLPDYAPLGGYYVNLMVADRYFGAPFQVQQYRKPEYLVEVTTARQDYVAGEQIDLTAAASYFFGGPVAGAQVTTRVQAADYQFFWTDPDTGAYYDFQDMQVWQDRLQGFGGQVRSETTTAADANGQVKWTIPADTGNRPLSQLVTVEAAVRDSSNQEVSSNTQLIVHRGQFYIGLRPDVYVGVAGKPVGVEVQVLGVDKRKHGAVDLKLSYYKRAWEQTVERDQSGIDRPTWKPVDTLLASENVRTDGAGAAAGRFTPAEAGEYRVAAEGRDALGNVVTSATYVWVADDDDEAVVAWRQKSIFAIDMVADKKEYKAGDTARILVTSPFRSATALLTIERGSIIEHRLVELSGNSPVIEVPIDERFLPNVYLSLSVVAPNGGEGGQPGFRQGWLALDVSAAEKELQVEITPSSDDVAPGQTVTYTITTRDAAGKPVAAEVSVAVVDKAIYSLAGDPTPSLSEQFYGHRALAFATASSMLVLQSQLAPGGVPGGKGGAGGGDAALGFLRRLFEDSAYWKADVTTGEDGMATVAVRLPDNLTTWRLTARAVTKDTLVGQATNEIVSSKDLLLRPVLPRFMLAGDRFQAGAIVHNYTTATLAVDVSLVVSGARMLNDAQGTKQLTIPAGGQAVAGFDVDAGTGASAVFTYTARVAGGEEAGGLSDAVEITLPVKPFLVPEVVATSGEVPGDAAHQEQVFLPHGVDTRFGELKLTVSPSLAAGTVSSLKQLDEHEWESANEIVSRFLPLLRLNQAYRAALQDTPYSGRLDDIVNRALQRLFSSQYYDGGWAWWNNGPTGAWMTAYVVEGLSAARAAGYQVPESTMTMSLDYLANWLNGTAAAAGGKGQPAPAGQSGAESPNTRAYVIYVLAGAGRGDVSQARALAARSNTLALYGRAYLALAFQRLGENDDAAELLKSLVAATKQTSTTAHWEEDGAPNPEYYVSMNTNTRTTALVLEALLRADKDDPLIPMAVRWLMQARREGHWLTSQETATVVGSLAQYLAVSGELSGSYSWSATLNNAQLGGGAVDQANAAQSTTLRRAVADLLINENNTLALLRQGSAGKMYYDLALSYYLPDRGIQARSEGLSVVREYLKPGTGKAGEAPQPLRDAAAGELVEVRLTVIVPADAYYLVVEDPLPAGLEGVDGTLATTGLTAQLDQLRGVDEFGNPSWYFFNNVEMRDDRVALFATFLPAGVYEYRYLARATTPGQFAALPSRAYLAYQPDVWGRSDGAVFVVRGR